MENKHNITHPEMVAKLIKQGRILQQEFTIWDFEIMHATFGIVGELGELLGGVDFAIGTGSRLDRENIVEELGDLEFFMENFRTLMNITRYDVLNCETVCIIPPAPVRQCAHMLIYGTELMDQVKKAIIYRKPINKEAILANLSKIEFILGAFRKSVDITWEETIEHNINKLSIRYKNFEYSNQQAQDRADKA